MSETLVKLLLPLYDNAGVAFGREHYAQVRKELTETFGGVTAYMQAPAEGVWEDEEGKVRQDRVVILEVMTPDLDRAWWTRYKRQLETRFRQDAIVIRASAIETL